MIGLLILLAALVGTIAFITYKLTRPVKAPPSSEEEPPGAWSARMDKIIAENVEKHSTDLVHVGAFPTDAFFGECDARCKAPALVQLRFRATGHVLALCLHHFRKSETALRALCDTVDDRSEALLRGTRCPT